MWRGGVTWRRERRTSLVALPEGWNSSRAPSPPPHDPPPPTIWQALVKTIPQLLVTRQIQLPFPLWRGARARGNPDRQRHRERRREEGFFFQKGLDKCRGRSSCFAILISYEGCLAGRAHRLVSVCVCVFCVAAAAAAAAASDGVAEAK